MYSYCWVWWNVQTEVDGDCFPPEILPFRVALVLSALTWLLVHHLSSVSVLMLVMPPIKIYIKSYNATRSHARDQSPGKTETGVNMDAQSPKSHSHLALNQSPAPSSPQLNFWGCILNPSSLEKSLLNFLYTKTVRPIDIYKLMAYDVKKTLLEYIVSIFINM